MGKRGEVYRFLAQQGTAPELPGIWNTLPCHPAFLQLSDDPPNLVAKLQAHCGADQLRDAAAVTVDVQGVASLNPKLSCRNSLLLPIHTTSLSLPSDVITGDCGTLRGHWTFPAVLDDLRMQELQGTKDYLLGVRTLQEMALFWSLRLPAVTVSGLDAMRGKHIDAFCHALRLPRRRGQSWTSSELPLKLVLVEWSPLSLRLEQTLEMDAVGTHLINLHDKLGIPLEQDCQIWRPTEDELSSIRFRWEHGDQRDVQEAMLESLDNSCRPLIGAADLASVDPQSYGAAVEDWITARDNTTDTVRQQAAWKRVQKLQESQLIQPLLARAQETIEPLTQSRLLALADMSRLIHNQALLLSAGLSRAIGDQGATAASMYPKQEFQQVMALADRIAALTTENKACRPRMSTSPATRPRTRPNTRASPASDLPTTSSQR